MWILNVAMLGSVAVIAAVPIALVGVHIDDPDPVDPFFQLAVLRAAITASLTRQNPAAVIGMGMVHAP